MGGQGNPRERNREGERERGGNGGGERETFRGKKNFKKRLGGNRFFLLWRHPPDPDVVCADSAAGDWEVTGDFKNMSIFATIDKLYPPNDWLAGSSLPSKFSPTIIESALNELTPNNVRSLLFIYENYRKGSYAKQIVGKS
ncbi:Insulin-degrading enzyme-like 2 [Camellia lanceoleosa]|uniref:Insulin-degrading enzyme-like 2 n=1 Tax=Camellia lanceoleosa TaxID=1840588 RepID=A0ACC0GW21_9ERIC|nr:Insulin-degrading enzyme-like 2 [Camellia lanceoleosa]